MVKNTNSCHREGENARGDLVDVESATQTAHSHNSRDVIAIAGGRVMEMSRLSRSFKMAEVIWAEPISRP